MTKQFELNKKPPQDRLARRWGGKVHIVRKTEFTGLCGQRNLTVGRTSPDESICTRCQKSYNKEKPQRLLRQVQGEAGLRRHHRRDEERHGDGQGQVPDVRHRHEPHPRKEEGLGVLLNFRCMTHPESYVAIDPFTEHRIDGDLVSISVEKANLFCLAEDDKDHKYVLQLEAPEFDHQGVRMNPYEFEEGDEPAQVQVGD